MGPRSGRYSCVRDIPVRGTIYKVPVPCADGLVARISVIIASKEKAYWIPQTHVTRQQTIDTGQCKNIRTKSSHLDGSQAII